MFGFADQITPSHPPKRSGARVMTYFVFDAVSFIFFLAGTFFQAIRDGIHFLPRKGDLLHDF